MEKRGKLYSRRKSENGKRNLQGHRKLCCVYYSYRKGFGYGYECRRKRLDKV